MAGIVEVRTAGANMAELVDAQNATMRAIRDLPITINSGINVKENRVELWVTDPVGFQRILRDAGIRLPDHVELVKVGVQAKPS